MKNRLTLILKKVITITFLLSGILIMFTSGVFSKQSSSVRSTCIRCHLMQNEEELREPAVKFNDDIHNKKELGCVTCHGGNNRSDDPSTAMSSKWKFIGAPDSLEIPNLCGSCHSNDRFIKKFNPNLPTDQLSQYWTSIHGRQIKAGDKKAATCISCHGVHNIRSVTDPRSTVYPTHVVETCAKCHSDKKLMKYYNLPVDIVSKYKKSVHYQALIKQNDLSAPTCNDCHGSHGATPPGVNSVSNVCGTCHVKNMELFQQSPHAQAFSEMEIGACEACHGHHKITHPTDALLGIGEKSICGQCHDKSDKGGEVAIQLRQSVETSLITLNKAEKEVKEVSQKGILMEKAEIDLQSAHQDLLKARILIHKLSSKEVDKLIDNSLKSSILALKLSAKARKEIRYRRNGLLIALILIFITIVLLAIKIRTIEK